MPQGAARVPRDIPLENGAYYYSATVFREQPLQLVNWQRANRLSVRRRVGRFQERVVDCLFGRIERRLEKSRDAVCGKNGPRLRPARRRHAKRRMRRESNCEVSAAV